MEYKKIKFIYLFSQAAHVEIFPSKSSLQLKIREVRQKLMAQNNLTPMTPSGLASPMASGTDSTATTPGMFMVFLLHMHCISRCGQFLCSIHEVHKVNS
jgi:hypothetical protein